MKFLYMAVITGLFFAAGGTLVRYATINKMADWSSSFIVTQSIVATMMFSIITFLNFRNYGWTTATFFGSCLFAAMAVMLFLLSQKYNFHPFLISGGVAFGISVSILYYIIANSNMVLATIISRSSALVGGIGGGIFVLGDYPKHWVQWVGIMLIIFGIILITLWNGNF